MTKQHTFSVLPASEREVTWQSVKRLYDAVGWWSERNESEIKTLLVNSIVVAAWSENELIGFARAISDKTCRAYLEDVVVHPHFQRQRIGSELLNVLLQELSTIDLTSLFCDESLADFYEQLGFKLTRQRVLHLGKTN